MKGQLTDSTPFWVWTLKFYDNYKKTWVYKNCPNLHMMIRYRNYIIGNKKRYSKVSELYQRDIGKFSYEQ